MADRRFPVPVAHQAGLLGAAATMERIDLAATLGDEWAVGLRAKENTRLLDQVLGGDARLPRGATDDDDLVVGLYRDEQAWTKHGWEPAPPPPGTLVLDGDEVAFVARALLADCSVRLLPYTPVAVLGAGPAGAPAGDAGLPPGTKVLAVVDDMDRDAVLDVVAVLPGPKIKRRHDGKWVDDPGWVSILRSVRPPPIVVLEDDQVGDVLPQIDSATSGEPFEVTKKQAATASAYTDRADEMIIEWAVTAAGAIDKAMSKLTPGGTMPPKLRKYWTTGAGAAKIRWGTPGAWTRCHRYLSKYIGPFRAKGACTNLGKLRGGKGVAWDV